MNCGSKRTFPASLCYATAIAGAVILIGALTLRAQQQAGSSSDSAAVKSSSATESAAPSAPAGDAEKGKIAFEKYRCFACHGHSGDGGISPYPTQAGFRQPRPVVTGAHLAGMPLSLQAFISYVRKPGGRMPAFGNNITDADLADIYVFLKSQSAPPDPKSIPLDQK